MTVLVERRPGPGRPRPYTFPTVVRSTVGDGQVVAAHLPGRPLAVATLLLDAGAAREPAAAAGLAVVVAKALEEGTGRRDAAAFALALEGLGAKLFTSVDWDTFRAGVEAPVRALPAAVELLAEAVRSPRLATADLLRVRDDEAEALRVEWASPGPRASAALRAALFPEGSRHASPPHGDPDSVAGLDPADLTAFHTDWLGRAGVLLVAGDLDQLDLDALGAVAFAGSGPSAPAESGLVTGVPIAGPRIVLVDRPGSVQSALRLGHTGPHRAHPDHVPVSLAGTVLGGAFTSRLNHLIREVRGYTYGIRAEFSTTRRFGRFTVSAAVRTEVTAPALVDTVAEIARTAAEGVGDEEVGVARTWRAGSLSVDMQTPGAIAGALGTLVVHGLPDDYYPTYREQLLSASAQEVSRAAATHIRPERLTIVVEGDADAVRDDLRDSGVGDLVENP